jgi:Mrp family chromosome partitioning ATPase
MDVVLAGSGALRPAELLGSSAFSDFLAVLSRSYGMVFVDSPPLLSVADPLNLVTQVDAIVLCARANQTTRDQLRAALDMLGQMPPRPTGIVVTGVEPADAGEYGAYAYEYASR